MKKINIVFLFVLLFTLLFTTTVLANNYNSGVVTIDTNWSGTLQEAVEATGASNVYAITELHITSAVTNTLTTDDIAYINQMVNIAVLDVADTVTVGDVGNKFLGGVGGYSDLTTVNFPATTFGNDAFSFCDSLTTISLPNATTFGDSTLACCSFLSSVSMPLAETFGNDAFSWCEAIDTINLPNATTFGNNAFSWCSVLTNISLPEAVTFGNSALSNCDLLTTIDFPNATTFGTYTFAQCPLLETITLPKVISFGINSLYSLGSLTTVDMAVATTFADYAFSQCGKLTTVNLPKAATFGTNAFRSCSALTSINLPEATTFGDYSFLSNTLLETVTLPKATTFGEMVFYGCPALKNVSLPKASSFTDYAFTSCKALESISLPELKSLGNKAFINCSNLTQVSLPMIQSFGNDTFDGNFKRIALTLGSTIPSTSSTSFKAFNLLSANAYLIVPAHMEAAYDNVDGMDGYFRGFHINPFYDITYNGNGSTSGIPPTDSNNPYLEFDDVTILGNVGNLQKDYYTFSGWNTIDDGSGTDYLSGSTTSITSDLMLYAKWTATPYTITYHLDGGTNYVLNKASYTVEDNVTLYGGFKDGYLFSGWYTDSSLSDASRIYSIPKGSNGDVELWAKWEARPYNITYNVFSGTNNPANPATYTILDSFNFSAPTRDHYTFGGWYTNYSCTTGNEISGISLGSTGNIYVYAKWSPIPYSITYNLNGGTNSPSNPATYTIEDNVTFSNPSKTGYTFGGWYTDSACSTANRIYSLSTGTYGNKEIWAKWTPTPYNITYHLDSGTNHLSNPATYTIEDAVVFGSPSKIGYTFGGWYTDSACTSSNETIGIPLGSTGEVDVYAKWTPITYNITYNLNGSTNSPSNPATYTIEDNVTFSNPSKTGYTFGGWYTDSACSTANRIYSLSTGTYGDKQIWAKWTPTPYNITYHLDSGTNHLSNPATYTIKDAVVFSSPSKTGYTFGGWFTDSDCTSGNEISSIPLGSTGEVDVYAKWTPIIYNITYNLNGSTNSPSNPATYTIEDNVTFSNPSKTGYTFGGWYTDSGCTSGNEISNLPLGSTGNVTVYAKWTPTPYTITYHLDGGTNHLSNPADYTIEDAVVFGSPSKTGYTFGGWHTEPIIDSKVFGIGVGSTDNVTLYARWTPIYYNISYQLDGGTNHTSNPATYTIEEVVTLNAPSKDGYTFSGWYTDSALSEGNEITEIAVGSTGDKAVYAKWIPIPVSSVQFDKESETFTVGITTSIGYSLLPIDAANKNVSYSSSNTDIATVDASGMITALKQGITLITISSQENPAIYDTLLLTVSEPATPEPPETFSATIKGKLIDSTGVPLAHYPITLCSDPQTVITGSDGSFEFTGVPLTSHTLIVNNTTTNELGRFAINFTKGTTNSSTIDNGLKEIDVAFTSRTLSIDVTLQTNPMLTDFSAAAIGYKVKPPDAKVENPCTGYFE